MMKMSGHYSLGGLLSERRNPQSTREVNDKTSLRPALRICIVAAAAAAAAAGQEDYPAMGTLMT